MGEDIRLAKRFLESKGYQVEEPLVFEGMRDSDVISLKEFVNIHGNDSIWESTFEEDLLEAELSGAQLKDYRVGDIIMPKGLYSPNSNSDVSEHRVLLLYVSNRGEDGVVKYKGFLMSSEYQKSNKYTDKYPNNIYIADYSTILRKGAMSKKKVFIRVDDIVEFDSTDLDTSGVWKGHVSDKFFRFVNNCYRNYTSGISNANKYWISERGYEDVRRNSQETA